MTHQVTKMFQEKPALIECLPHLNNLRVAGKLTDLTIELQDGVQIHAHRIVVASRVPSLCDALCESPTKDQAVVLKWPTISSEAAAPFINYIYTGQLEVHEANATSLIVLSQQLAMPKVEEWAVSFLATSLDSKNMENYWELAQVLKSDQLRNAVLHYTKKTFKVTAMSDSFLQLPSEAVLSLVQADDLQVDSEETVLKAIGRWISPLGKVDETRLLHGEAMMREVRWNRLDANFRYRLQDDDEGFWNKNVGCSRLLGLITKWIDIPSSRGNKPCPFNERSRGQLGSSQDRECPIKKLGQNPLRDVCLLGRLATESELLLTWYDADTKMPQKLTNITCERDAVFVVIKDCIFTIGGNERSSNNNYTSMDKFDRRERRWSACASMFGWREKHTAVAVEFGKETVICVCGGNTYNFSPTVACSVYFPHQDKWYSLSDMKQPKRSAASVALPDGRVFVIGGEALVRRGRRENMDTIPSVETYNFRTLAGGRASEVVWTDAADMRQARKDHTAVLFRDSIFVAGGYCYSDSTYFTSAVEVFTPPDNQRPLGQWTLIYSWNPGRPPAAVVASQDRLFYFSKKDNSPFTLLEFVPPADPSAQSQGKFDLWTWVDRGTMDGFLDIRGAFLLP